jgi:hypothetical protein
MPSTKNSKPSKTTQPKSTPRSEQKKMDAAIAAAVEQVRQARIRERNGRVLED